jgi:hypothetical protein
MDPARNTLLFGFENLVAKNSSGRKSFNQRHILRDWRLSMTATGTNEMAMKNIFNTEQTKAGQKSLAPA